MEINGRYWGSLPLSLNAGIDFPYYEWQLAHGQEPAATAAYTDGFRTVWRTGELLRLVALVNRWLAGQTSAVALVREFVRAFADIVSFTPDAIWDWHDPRPAWLEFRYKVLRFDGRKLLARMLPGRLVASLRIRRDWGLRTGWIHWRQSIRRRRRPVEQPLPSHLHRVLFVC